MNKSTEICKLCGEYLHDCLGHDDQPAPAACSAPPFEELHREYLEWVKVTFPDETVEAQMEHLDEEFDELIQGEWKDPSEFADVLMLLCCVAHGQGIDIFKAFREKFAVNKARTWEKTAKGFRHVQNARDGRREASDPSTC